MEKNKRNPPGKRKRRSSPLQRTSDTDMGFAPFFDAGCRWKAAGKPCDCLLCVAEAREQREDDN